MSETVDAKELIRQSATSLPTLPNVFVSILELVTKERTSADEVAEIIGRDQSLTSRVLAIANSSAYSFRDRIPTVSRATALLGFDVIKNLVLSVSVFDDFLKGRDVDSFDKTKFWEHCLICATVAKEVAHQSQCANPDEAFVAGLLHDVGKIALDSAIKETYSKLLKDISGYGATPLALERKYLGTDHAEVAGILAEKWKLPDDISTAMRYHHEIPDEGLSTQQERMTAVVVVADFICWTDGKGSFDSIYPPLLNPRAKELVDMDKLDMDKVYEAIDQQIKSTAEIFGLAVPNLKKFRAALMNANIELGHINSLYEEAKFQLERQVQELSCLNRAIYLIRQDLDVDATVKALLRAIREELGFVRAHFFKVGDQEEEFYLVDFVVDSESEESHSLIGLDILKSTLLSRSIKENKSIRFKNEPEWENDPLFSSLDTDEVFVIPIPSKEGFVGVVAADNHGSQMRSIAGSVESLNILAQEAGLAIENAMLFERTRQLATRDGLTDLYNRRYCMQYLEAEIRRSKRYNHPLSVAMFDIDHFKKLNDTLGHQAGDKVLGTVALLLLSCSRETDIVGRYGGEEFIAILPETPSEGASTYAERVCEAVEQYGKVTQEESASSVSLTISGGLSVFDPNKDTSETIVNRADQALYRAKRNGRNRIEVL